MQHTHINTIPDIPIYLETVKQSAHVPVSQFKVGALAVATTGNVVAATNWEFKYAQTGHSNTIHAEQAAIGLARYYQTGPLEKLYVTEWPCGHCRQFLCELGNPNLEIIHTPSQETIILRHLLTESFDWYPNSTTDQKNTKPSALDLTLPIPKELTGNALAKHIMQQSYRPYSNTASGVIIQTDNREIYCGSLIESNAYNPSLPAFQAAWIAYWSANDKDSHITHIMMREHQENLIFYRHQAEDCIEALKKEQLLDPGIILDYQIV